MRDPYSSEPIHIDYANIRRMDYDTPYGQQVKAKLDAFKAQYPGKRILHCMGTVLAVVDPDDKSETYPEWMLALSEQY